MPIITFRDKSFIVCARDVPSESLTSVFFHARTESKANTLVSCDDSGEDVRMPKSMARFRQKFRFDYVICFDCFVQAVKDGKIDAGRRAGAGTLLTMPGFLSAGQWAMHTGGQGRYIINKSGDIAVVRS